MRFPRATRQLETFPALSRMSAPGGEADVIGAKADIQTTREPHACYSVSASLWFGGLIPVSARTDSCIFAAGGKGDRAAPLMRRLADERSRVSVHGLTGMIHLMWPFITWFTESIFTEDRLIVEAEQRAFDQQGADWNQEICPAILALRDVLIKQGSPLANSDICASDKSLERV